MYIKWWKSSSFCHFFAQAVCVQCHRTKYGLLMSCFLFFLHQFSPRRIYCRVPKFCMRFMSHVDGWLRGESRMHRPGSDGPHRRWWKFSTFILSKITHNWGHFWVSKYPREDFSWLFPALGTCTGHTIENCKTHLQLQMLLLFVFTTGGHYTVLWDTLYIY